MICYNILNDTVSGFVNRQINKRLNIHMYPYTHTLSQRLKQAVGDIISKKFDFLYFFFYNQKMIF